MAEMKKHIRILGMRFKIKKVPDDHEVLKGKNGVTFYAVILHTKNKICVSNKLTKLRRQKSILHEIIHVIDAELRLGLSHKNVYRLASGLASSSIRIKAKKS